jgi:hypothetical protein
MKIGFIVAVAACGVLATVSEVNAAIVTFTGYDPGQAAPIGPNSAAGQASFLAAAGPTSEITFETPLPGNVTITGGSITNASSGFALFGGNTTPGGAFYLQLVGGTATFNFANPISVFGAYFSGVQLDETLTFNDGSSQTVTVPGGGTSVNSVGGMSFAGFTDFGASISSITVNAGPGCSNCDIIGVDDVFITRGGSAIPEPATWTLMLLGFASLGYGGYREARRRARVAVAGP